MKEARRRGDLVNVWKEAGLGRNELRHAAVLAWLLNERGTHGRGSAILESWLCGLRTLTGTMPVPTFWTARICDCHRDLSAVE
jgi:hypothetical protein